MSKPKPYGFFRLSLKDYGKLVSNLALRLDSQAAVSGNFRLKINATTIATAPM